MIGCNVSLHFKDTLPLNYYFLVSKRTCTMLYDFMIILLVQIPLPHSKELHTRILHPVTHAHAHTQSDAVLWVYETGGRCSERL